MWVEPDRGRWPATENDLPHPPSAGNSWRMDRADSVIPHTFAVHTFATSGDKVRSRSSDRPWSEFAHIQVRRRPAVLFIIAMSAGWHGITLRRLFSRFVFNSCADRADRHGFLSQSSRMPLLVRRQQINGRNLCCQDNRQNRQKQPCEPLPWSLMWCLKFEGSRK
jgi:hypothetical protein